MTGTTKGGRNECVEDAQKTLYLILVVLSCGGVGFLKSIAVCCKSLTAEGMHIHMYVMKKEEAELVDCSLIGVG
jgi:hypothetical protein